MPKRSNEFQKLIRRIYAQTKLKGAVVTESALLRERESSAEREVDVLIELRAAGIEIRIGVECRDRSRPATVEWIDEIIGKYKHLPVHRLIAVSRAGFTKEAIRKAHCNEIETRTLREAMGSDWPRDLLEPFLARVTVDVRILRFVPHSQPVWPDGELPAAVRLNGRTIEVREYLRQMTDGIRDQIGPYVAARQNEFRTLRDFTRKFELVFKVNTPRAEFESEAGTTHAADTTYVRCEIQLGYVDLPVQRRLFGNVGVTTAVDLDAKLGPVTLTIAQEPGGRLPLPVISRPGEPDDDPPAG